MALGQVLLQALQFSLISIVPLMLHTLHVRAALTGRANGLEPYGRNIKQDLNIILVNDNYPSLPRALFLKENRCGIAAFRP